MTGFPQRRRTCFSFSPWLPALARMTPSEFMFLLLGSMPIFASAAKRMEVPLVARVIASHGGHGSGPNIRDGIFADPSKRMAPEKILLAGDDLAIAEDREPAADARARFASRRLHLNERYIRNLSREIGWGGDDGAGERAEPVVVPSFHLGEVGRGFDESRDEEWRAARSGLALMDQTGEIFHRGLQAVDGHDRVIGFRGDRGEIDRDDVDRKFRDAVEQVRVDFN